MALPRFAIAGALNTGLTYLLYLALLQFIPYWVAYSVTYIVGLLLGYGLNCYLVFKVRPSLRSAAMYPVSYVVNYLLGICVLVGLVRILGVAESLAPILGTLVLMPLTYVLMRYAFVKKKKCTNPH